MKVSRLQTLIPLVVFLHLPDCNAYGQNRPDGIQKITVNAVQSKAATITLQYPCLIKSRHYIDVRAPEEGHLTAVPVKEGQTVNRGDSLFQIGHGKGKDKVAPENQDIVVSIKAPFDGVIGRLIRRQGSFVLKDDILTTLYDSSTMSAYFDVPEDHYLENVADLVENQQGHQHIELILADHRKYPKTGKIGAILARFGGENSDIPFRADFPNPTGALRHGQTGTLVMSFLYCRMPYSSPNVQYSMVSS